MEVSSQLHGPAALAPVKEPRIHNGQEAVLAHSRCGRLATAGVTVWSTAGVADWPTADVADWPTAGVEHSDKKENFLS